MAADAADAAEAVRFDEEEAPVLLRRRRGRCAGCTWPVLALYALAAGNGALWACVPFFYHHQPMPRGDEDVRGYKPDCHDGTYSDTTLKLLYATPFARILGENRRVHDGELLSTLEASDVVANVGDGNRTYAVFDNAFSVASLNSQLKFGGAVKYNKLLQWPSQGGNPGASEFEGIAEGPEGLLYIMVETRELGGTPSSYAGFVYEVRPNDDAGTLSVVRGCRTEFEFSQTSKGFEGVAFTGNSSLLLGLCEGNFCQGSQKGRQPGNGRIVIMQKQQQGSGGDDDCLWSTVGLLPIPPAANFEDYSAISIRPAVQEPPASSNCEYLRQKHGDVTFFDVAIASQRNAALYIGMLCIASSGDALFVESLGRVLNFPRGVGCTLRWCNVEGIAWIDADKVVAVTDQMKRHGRQPFFCLDADQSVATFLVP